MNSRDSAESLLFLEFQYLFLSKIDHNFPFGGHEADILEVFYFVQHIAVCVSMRTKKVVVKFTAVMAALIFQAEMFPVLVSGRDNLRKGAVLNFSYFGE